ncbi:MAG: hypothetical protein WCD37_06575 [Chloroflexia bacterium]
MPSSEGKSWRGVAAGSVFLLGVGLCACGVALMGSTDKFAWLPFGARDWLSKYVANPGALLVGGVVALLGAILAGWVGRGVMPTQSKGIYAPALRLERYGLMALGLGIICFGLIYWHLLAGQYTHWDFALFVAGLASLAFGINRLDRGRRGAKPTFRLADAGISALIAAVVVSINMVQLTRWNFAWIGDEGSFYGLATDIAWDRIPWNVFSLKGGVYSIHPVMDSAWQSVGMNLFGVDVFGWRMSEVMMLGMAGPLAFLAGTALMGRVAGIVAGLALGTNHYVMAFGRIGYNNVHIVFWVTLVILMLALAWRTQRAVYLFGLGAALGMCFYTFIAATLSWPIAGIVLLMALLVKFSRRAWTAIALPILGFVAVVTPGLILTPLDYLTDQALNNSVRQVPPGGVLEVAQQALVKSIAIFWDNQQWRHHFVGGPLADYVTGALLVVGLGVALFRLKAYPERLLAIWFAVGLVLVAVTGYLPQPSLTRLLFVMPAVALLAGLGTQAVAGTLTSRFKLDARVAGVVLVVGLAVAIPLVNLKQLLVDTPALVGANRQIMLIKALQEHPQNTIVEVAPKPDDNIEVLLRMYPDLRGRYTFMPLGYVGPSAIVNGRPPVYFVSKENESLAEDLRRRLPGYEATTDADDAGEYHVRLFVRR